jgi:hypothetical protein
LGKRCHFFSAAYIDPTSKVGLIYCAQFLSSNFIGIRFHGMRGLSGDKISEELIVTSSCDRDVRVWKIWDEMIECVDEVKGVDSVTHAVCAVHEFCLHWRVTRSDFEVED